MSKAGRAGSPVNTPPLERNEREVRNHIVMIYLCVDVNDEVIDLWRLFNLCCVRIEFINSKFLSFLFYEIFKV